MNQIISKINMELQQRQWQPAVDVVQNDCYMRILELTMTSGGEAWDIPEDASVLIRYLRSDGMSGTYDTLSDGTSAWSAQGNKLNLTLVPEMMTVSGLVQLWVSIIQREQQISTFSVALNVSALSGSDQGDAGVLGTITGFLPAPDSGEIGQFLRVTAVNERGKVTALETADLGADAVLLRAQSLSQEQQAQARANIGAVGSGEVPAGAVLWNPQTLTQEQQAQARANIGAAGSGEMPADAVCWSPQTLTEAQKRQVRQNISAMGIPAAAEVGQVIAVKAVNENGVPVEWETVSMQNGAVTDAVLYTEQALTDSQKAQVRQNIGVESLEMQNLTSQIAVNYPDNLLVVRKDCRKYGRICSFTIQINVMTAISANYGFALATLPCAPAGRIWINHTTQFYMDEGSNEVKVNSNKLDAKNYILSGIFLTDS